MTLQAAVLVFVSVGGANLVDALRLQGPEGEQCFFDGSSLPAEYAQANPPSSTLTIGSEFLAQLKKLPPIPQKSHVTWPHKDVIYSKSDMVKYGLRNLIDLNPGWENKVWNDTEVDEFLEERLSKEDWNLLKDRGYAEKSDIWRLILLYCEGGYYQDLDRIYNIPFTTVIEPETRMLLPMKPVDFSQDLMASSPGNPVFKKAIELNLQRRRASSITQGVGTVLGLGPETYFHAVTKVMYGVMLNRGDRSLLNRTFDLINEVSPVIKTKQESWCHLIVAEMPDCKWISRAGLYGEQKMTAWPEKEKMRSLQFYKHHPTLLFGLQTSSPEIYEKLYQTQVDTWASEMTFLIAGGKHDNIGSLSVCTDRDQTCKEAALLYHAGKAIKNKNFDWFVSFHEDAYINVPKLVQELTSKHNATEPVVFSGFGCGQGFEHHAPGTKRSAGWVDPPFSCKSVFEKGGMCSGGGYVVSRQALDLLTREHNDVSEFINWYISLWTGDPKAMACDLAMSCALWERSIMVKRELMSTDYLLDKDFTTGSACKTHDQSMIMHLVGNKTRIPEFMQKIKAQC